jgi:hypothetical protein
MWGVALVMP